jgi:hypothetical protein
MDGLTVLVVRKAYAGYTHLSHDRFIRGNFLRVARPAFAFAILVVPNTVYRYVFPV